MKVRALVMSILCSLALAGGAFAADNGGGPTTTEQVCEQAYDTYWSAYDKLLSIKNCQTAKCNIYRIELTEIMRQSAEVYANLGCDALPIPVGDRKIILASFPATPINTSSESNP